MYEQEHSQGPNAGFGNPKCGINHPHTFFLRSVVSQACSELRTVLEAGLPLMSFSLVPFQRALLALFLLTSCMAHAVTRGVISSPNVAEQLLLSEANQDRVARNLNLLKRDPMLSQAALYHAFQMADHADISHGFPGEPDLSQRGASAGVHFSLITENVAEAQDPTIIHDLWMHSSGHRANLLDPAVNVVGIAVVTRNEEVFAVEDFASTVETMSLDQQELTVAALLNTSGLSIGNADTQNVANARQTCTMSTGYAGLRQPWYIMRYTASRLDQLPEQIKTRLGSGRYKQAVIGACPPTETGVFSSYSIAILLYP